MDEQIARTPLTWVSWLYFYRHPLKSVEKQRWLTSWAGRRGGEKNKAWHNLYTNFFPPPHPQAVKYLLKPTNHNSEIDNFISATEENRHVFTDRNQLTDGNIY